MSAFVFLDVDDTLLDFHRAEATALSRALREMGVEPREQTLRRYSEINRRQWELLEDGLLTRDEVLLSRFELLFEELGVTCSAEETRDRYEEYLAIGHWFMPGAEALLEELRGRYRLFIVSNGSRSVQAGRIASAGIAAYFEQIFISEDIGREKPDREFFTRCFARIPGFDLSRAIIVGDSLTSDIRGGRSAGMLTCWYNPRGWPPRDDIRPDYHIETLSELPGLLAGLFPEEKEGLS